VVDTSTGEVVVEANVELTADRLHKVLSSGATSFEVFFPDRDDVGNIITNTLKRDSVHKPEEALIEIYRKLRPGDPPTLDTATALFEGMFFDARKYDFSRVGRLKFNIKLYDSQDATHLDHRTLTPEDSTRPFATCSSCARTSAWWTTSITWATAACAPWAS